MMSDLELKRIRSMIFTALGRLLRGRVNSFVLIFSLRQLEENVPAKTELIT